MIDELQVSLANIYTEILEGDILQTQDCPPCFGDKFIATQDLEYGEYDERNDAIFIGWVFRTKQEMRTALAVYAVKRFFNFQQIKSDKKRLVVACIDRRCPWRVYGRVCGGSSVNFEIRTATLRHTCDVSTRAGYGKKASCNVIAQVLRSKYAHGQIGPRAVDIPAIVLEKLHVSVSYMRAWHAKELAVAQARGTADGSYKLLLSYLYRLKETNGRTVSVVEKTSPGKDEKIKFQYLFFSIGACIAAVKYMRRVVIVDATAIKSKFKGCLLTASCQDGNFQILPICFSVVNSENDASWTWFFSQLANIIPDADDLVFVSDRHASIYKGLGDVYPRAGHSACAVHLYRNVKAKFRRAGVAHLFVEAAAAYTVGEFRANFEELERRSAACGRYLRDIGIGHWSRAYFPGKIYNITNSNVAESLNAAVAKALEFPIVTMVESIRLMLMRWFYERREEAERNRSTITKEVEEMLMTNLENSGPLAVAPATNAIYQVTSGGGESFTIDLDRKSCSCRSFDILGIPCCHAMAAARHKGSPIGELVDVYYSTEYWRKAYEGIVMPVPDEANVDVPEEMVNAEILPPATKQGAGRPKKRRIPSVGETRIS